MDKAECDRLCKDLRVGADVMAMNDVFPTGQSMMKQAADEIERLRDALVRIQDLTQHNMGMSARDETCVWHEATKALKETD